MAPKHPSSARPRRGAAPAGYDASEFPPFAVTVDVVILTIRDRRLQVLLVQRRGDPYAGAWALPGGFKQPDETLDAAAARELREETSIAAPAHLTQFGAYGDPGRDPRTNVVTVAYLAAVPAIAEVAAGTDASDARVWPVDEVLGGDVALAFDHDRILRDAADCVARDLERTDLALAFLPPDFTLTDLQDVFEAAWHVEFDTANFRRSLASDPSHAFVVPTGQRAPAGPRGGRPPQLFRAGSGWSAGSPIRHP